jgi:hypothetical protein
MARHNSPSYVNFFEELPASEEAAESTDAEASLEDDDTGFDEDLEESEDKAEDQDDAAESEEADSEDDSKDESKDEPDEKSKPEATKDKSDDEKQKAINKEMAEKRIKERKEKEEALVKQQQEYIAEADKDDPRDLAVRQLQVDAYNNKVEGNSNKLSGSYERAIKDFQVLSDQSPEVQAEVNEALDAFQAMYVTIDSYGNPTEVRGDLYKFLQAKADSIERLTSMGAHKQTESKAKEKSKVLTAPVRGPKEGKADPGLDAFDEEANRW